VRYLYQQSCLELTERKGACHASNTVLALGFIGAAALTGAAPALAQGFNFDGPGVHVRVGNPDRYYSGPRYYDYYPGPAGGDFETWNGCPPGYTRSSLARVSLIAASKAG